jgi:hypothetical protein
MLRGGGGGANRQAAVLTGSRQTIAEEQRLELLPLLCQIF